MVYYEDPPQDHWCLQHGFAHAELLGVWLLFLQLSKFIEVFAGSNGKPSASA